MTSVNAGGRPATVAPANAGGGATIAINDDDFARVVFSQTPPFGVSEGAGTVRVTVRLTAPVDVPFTAAVFAGPSLPALTPATVSDYTPTIQTFTFSGAEFQRFDFDVPITDDNTVEPDETFAIGITIGIVPGTGTRDVGPGPNLPVDIRDNDVAVISIQNARIYETDAATPTVGTVNYTLSQPSDSVTTFVINATAGTAAAGTDYDATVYPLTVTVPPNVTSGTFTIPIINNTTWTYNNLTFTLTATAAVPPPGSNNVSISATNGTATITIVDDEWPWE
jgi:hypothetical protein